MVSSFLPLAQDVQSGPWPVQVFGARYGSLNYFKFVGRLVVFHHRLLDAYFAPGVYKMAFNKKVNLKDLEAFNYELHKGHT